MGSGGRLTRLQMANKLPVEVDDDEEEDEEGKTKRKKNKPKQNKSTVAFVC